MTVHHCPQCELTFSFKTELEWHLREDHQPTVDLGPVAGLHKRSTMGRPPMTFLTR